MSDTESQKPIPFTPAGDQMATIAELAGNGPKTTRSWRPEDLPDGSLALISCNDHQTTALYGASLAMRIATGTGTRQAPVVVVTRYCTEDYAIDWANYFGHDLMGLDLRYMTIFDENNSGFTDFVDSHTARRILLAYHGQDRPTVIFEGVDDLGKEDGFGVCGAARILSDNGCRVFATYTENPQKLPKPIEQIFTEMAFIFESHGKISFIPFGTRMESALERITFWKSGAFTSVLIHVETAEDATQ